MDTTNIKHNLEKPSKLHTETREQEKASSVPAGNDFCRFEWEGGGHYVYADIARTPKSTLNERLFNLDYRCYISHGSLIYGSNYYDTQSISGINRMPTTMPLCWNQHA